jgi:hypothetical protein
MKARLIALRRLLRDWVTPAFARKVFFVLSTGRCGTKHVAALLDQAENGTVCHEPAPGCERVNPIAAALFFENRERFLALRVSDFRPLHTHARLFRSAKTEVFGDCYNSLYTFAVPLFRYYRARGMSVKFVHLVRNPVACCSSILRAEGPQGLPNSKDFAVRAPCLSSSPHPAERASDIWININHIIQEQMGIIEGWKKDTTRMVRVEDLDDREQMLSLFRFLDLQPPPPEKIHAITQDTSYEVRHSHQAHLDGLGFPKVTDCDVELIRQRTAEAARKYGYSVKA